MSHSVFISYRRDGGEGFAQMFYMLLSQRGYQVFYDLESLGVGVFNEKILRNIEEAEVFLILLTKGALDRCANDGDWVRREIAHALSLGKPVIPLFFRGFEFPTTLPADIQTLPYYNGANLTDMQYFDAKVDHLSRMIDLAAGMSHGAATPAPAPKPTPKIPPNAVYAERGRPGLTDVVIPDGMTEIEDEAFRDCENLKTVIIPNSVKSIGESAFEDCSGLTSVAIPDSVTSIGDCAFDGCSGLTNVTIPDSVTSIGYYAFYKCSALTSVTIPDSVTSIGFGAFWGCSKLTTIRFTGTKAQWQAIDKDLYWDDETPAYTVYCRDGSISK